ncbi:MAG: DUF3168 domain-containing protein [Planctomycetota bacterium]
MAITDEDIAWQIERRLATDSDVAGLVGNRIRPQVIEPNEAMPAIRYEELSHNYWPLLNQPMTDGQTRLQIDCYGQTSLQARQVAAAVKSSLHGFSGLLGSIRVFDCVMDTRYDRVDPPPPGGKSWRKRRTMDFLISHSEPAPTL